MKIVDFLVLNLANWFNGHRNRLKWSTPIQRATYIAGIVTMLWTFNFWIIVNHFFPEIVTGKPVYIILLIVGLGTMQLYRYIYINKGRYERLTQDSIEPYNSGDKLRQVLSIIFVFLSLTTLFILIVNFAPPK